MRDYQLRRIWLTPEEEQGYYYGFANEGLWPLCHVAHVRPVFRESDWEAYQAGQPAICRRRGGRSPQRDPVVLVQDYHFALLPAMIRERLPQATILTFWHIPGPTQSRSASVRGDARILQGMLGAPSSASIPASIARTSWRPSIATWRHGSGTSTPPSATRTKRPWSKATHLDQWPQEVLTAAGHPGAMPSTRDRSAAASGELLSGHRHRPLRHEGHHRNGSMPWSGCWRRAPEWIGRFVFVQVAAPTRAALTTTATFRSVERVDGTHQRASRARLPTHPSAGSASRNRGGERAVPRSGHLRGHKPA